MKRRLFAYIISALFVSTAVMGCTTYDDDDDVPSNNNDNNDNNNNNNNNNTENNYLTADVGKTCAVASECSIGACDGRCLGKCTTADNCASGMICDAGTCRSVVDCPEDTSQKCFMTMSLTPSAAWLGSDLDPSAIGDNDFLSPYYKPILPKNQAVGEDYELMFCMRPIKDALNTNLQTTMIGELYKTLYGNPYSAYVRGIAYDHFDGKDTQSKVKSSDFCFDNEGKLRRSRCKSSTEGSGENPGDSGNDTTNNTICCDDDELKNIDNYCFDDNGEKIDVSKGGSCEGRKNKYTLLGGEIFDAIYYLHMTGYDNTLLLPGLIAAYQEFVSAGVTETEIDVTYRLGQVLMQAGSFMTDPRITGRMSDIGCIMFPIQTTSNQQIIPFSFKYTSDNPTFKGRPIYWQVTISNSALMDNQNRFVASIASAGEEKKLTEAVAYSKTFEFPINYSVTSYDTTTTKTGAAKSIGNDDITTFYFKANYKNTDSFTCNEFDITSGICPSNVTLNTTNCAKDVTEYDAKGQPVDTSQISEDCEPVVINGTTYYVPKSQTISMEGNCSSTELGASMTLAGYPNCTPHVSIVLENIKLYIQVDEVADADNIRK